MAIYHCSAKLISRAKGQSAIAAAAYRAGTHLHCQRSGRTANYVRRQGVVASRILIRRSETGNAIPDREAAWNAVEAVEVRRNACVAREFEIALPAELPSRDRAALAFAFGQALADRYGVLVDVAIHAPGPTGDTRNHHAHVLTSTRVLDADGRFGAKVRVLDARDTGPGEILIIREAWTHLVNTALASAGRSERIDHRSHVDLGLDQAPGRKIGVRAAGLEARTGTISTRRKDIEADAATSYGHARPVPAPLETTVDITPDATIDHERLNRQVAVLASLRARFRTATQLIIQGRAAGSLEKLLDAGDPGPLRSATSPESVPAKAALQPNGADGKSGSSDPKRGVPESTEARHHAGLGQTSTAAQQTPIDLGTSFGHPARLPSAAAPAARPDLGARQVEPHAPEPERREAQDRAALGPEQKHLAVRQGYGTRSGESPRSPAGTVRPGAASARPRGLGLRLPIEEEELSIRFDHAGPKTVASGVADDSGQAQGEASPRAGKPSTPGLSLAIGVYRQLQRQHRLTKTRTLALARIAGLPPPVFEVVAQGSHNTDPLMVDADALAAVPALARFWNAWASEDRVSKAQSTAAVEVPRREPAKSRPPSARHPGADVASTRPTHITAGESTAQPMSAEELARRRLAADYGLVLIGRDAWTKERGDALATLLGIPYNVVWSMAHQACSRHFGHKRPKTVEKADLAKLRAATMAQAMEGGFADLLRLMDKILKGRGGHDRDRGRSGRG